MTIVVRFTVRVRPQEAPSAEARALQLYPRRAEWRAQRRVPVRIEFGFKGHKFYGPQVGKDSGILWSSCSRACETTW